MVYDIELLLQYYLFYPSCISTSYITLRFLQDMNLLILKAHLNTFINKKKKLMMRKITYLFIYPIYFSTDVSQCMYIYFEFFGLTEWRIFPVIVTPISFHHILVIVAAAPFWFTSFTHIRNVCGWMKNMKGILYIP